MDTRTLNKWREHEEDMKKLHVMGPVWNEMTCGSRESQSMMLTSLLWNM